MTNYSRDSQAHKLVSRARFPRSSEENSDAANWRHRSNTRANVYIELKKVGSLAVVSCGSLLNYSEVPYVENFTSYSRWRVTLESSNMFKAIRSERQQGILRRAKVGPYKRMESALRSLGQMICLVVEDMEDPDLILGWAHLKRWAVENGMGANQDSVIDSIKWLGKTAQAIFLQAEVADENDFPIPRENGMLLPFCGPLKFISDLFFKRRERSDGFTLEEARSLAQIGSVSRALPYPSTGQIVKSVVETMSVLTDPPPPPSRRALRVHTQSVMKILDRCKPTKSTMTHMSLSSSGSLEASRTEGGRAGYLVKGVKSTSETIVSREKLSLLEGKIDCLGRQILHPVTSLLAVRLIDENPEVVFKLGDVLYTEPLELAKAHKRRVESSTAAPIALGWLMANSASVGMLEYGSFDNEPELILGLLAFDQKWKGKVSKFHMREKSIPVKASLSIEAGMKTRLVTAAPACVTQIGQLVGNHVRLTLSTDPFMRIGFEEADKLWETLGAYRKLKTKLPKSN